MTDMSGVVHCQPGGDGEKHLDVVQWQPGDKNHLTVKKGSMESPQKWARPAVSTRVAVTAARERREVVRSTF